MGRLVSSVRWGACLVLVLLCGACGPSSSEGESGGAAGEGAAGGSGGSSGGTTGGTGGTGNSSGTSGTSGTTSLPPTPAAVGLSLSLGPADPTIAGGRTCHAGTTSGFTYALGAPTPDRTIEDGKEGVSVSCLVRADGGFSTSGSGMDANGRKPISFSFSGSIEDRSAQANNTVNMGQMTFFSPDTLAMGSSLSGSPGCSYGPVQTLKAGAMLTDIDCPLIGAIDDTTSGCKVHGTIAFEYCETDSTENPLPPGG